MTSDTPVWSAGWNVLFKHNSTTNTASLFKKREYSTSELAILLKGTFVTSVATSSSNTISPRSSLFLISSTLSGSRCRLALYQQSLSLPAPSNYRPKPERRHDGWSLLWDGFERCALNICKNTGLKILIESGRLSVFFVECFWTFFLLFHRVCVNPLPVFRSLFGIDEALLLAETSLTFRQWKTMEWLCYNLLFRINLFSPY